ncbi:SemiSWEET family sugar transporter [Cardinium endosymbiont of Philonthus spinipes]|uniref:SemiSWEET family sugar transporter n=1 Tax=Cardinium endosymbiont of Philonthus spinipes TaxID=3077941 RepID=UPI00313B8ACD
MRVRSPLLVLIKFFLVVPMGVCAISFLDVVACIGSSTAVLSLLPQIIQSYRTKSVHDVSMLMLLNLTVSSISWTLYGAMTADRPLLLTNLLLTLGSLIMVGLKWKYNSIEH